ncbi:MAG: glycosyltransferase family 39 protein, partial [Candidatus Omnitrophica bacterium]|nr:glycosyltransferase family 39 protein [Candidatus Omnitrophota bacterium]
MKSSVDKKTLLYGIIFLGIILRVWGISFGLPYQFHQDESIIVNHAMAYGTGDLNPHFFSIPPFTSYLVFIFYGVMFILGKFIGIWNSAYNFALHFFKDPTIFYLAGRFLIGVIPGVGCIYYTYRISRKFFTEKTALYAAAVMAVSFLNVINSHYIYTDMILVFFILLATDGIYSIYRRGSWKDYCRAGILIGLAVGTKYNGALLLVPYCVTHFVLAKSEGMNFRKLFLAGKFWIGLLCVMGVFVVVNPFSVLDHQGFFSSVLKQGGAFSATGWKHHIFYSLAEGFSWRLTVCGIVGLILIFKKNTWGKILISFPLAYYVVLVFKSQSFARYVLPIVPFLSIGCGYLFFNFLPETLLEKKKNVKIFVISVAI